LEAAGAVAEEAEALAWGHFEETGDRFWRAEVWVWARGAVAVAVEAIAVWGAVAVIGAAVIGASAVAPAVVAAAVVAVVAV
jgi:hypothetical protein